jgi:hypothetical protein
MTDDSLLKDGPDASRKDPSKQKGILGAFLQFLFCLLLVAAADLVLFTGLAVQAAPEFAAWTALLLVFPVLPAGWHMGAERLRQTAPGGGFRRFGFRSAAIALIVLGTAAATPGPRIVTNSVSKFLGMGAVATVVPASKVGTPIVTPPQVGKANSEPHPLQQLVPSDANWVVAVRGVTAGVPLMRSHSRDMSDVIDALGHCQMPLDKIALLIAGRAQSEQMIALQGPGISEVSKLYCLVGVLGRNRAELSMTDPTGNGTITIASKLIGQSMNFKKRDANTLLAVSSTWQPSVDARLAGSVGGLEVGALAGAFHRVAREAPGWMLARTGASPGWDIALAVSENAGRGRLAMSARSPLGDEQRVELELQSPLQLATVLPEGVFFEGLRSMLQSILRVGAQVDGVVPPTAPPVDAGGL